MNSKLFPRALLAGLISTAASTVVLADHMSIWGEGWANMPNDIHNLRMEYIDDNDSFVSTVKYGAGAVTGGVPDTRGTESVSGGAGVMNQGTLPLMTGGRDRGRM